MVPPDTDAFSKMRHWSDRQQVNSTNPTSRFGDDGERMEPCCAVGIWARTDQILRCHKAAPD